MILQQRDGGKKQSMKRKYIYSPVKKMFWTQRSVTEVMLIVFGDMKGTITFKFPGKVLRLTMFPISNFWEKFTWLIE